MERMVAFVGSGIAFLGLIWGILLPNFGLTIAVIGVIITLFGLFFDDEF